MSIAPPRKKSRAVFWISTIIIGTAILATVLLANDKRNLRTLTQYYHITWFDSWLHQDVPVAAKPVVAVRTKPRLAQVQAQIPLPEHAFDKAPSTMPVSFIRTWKISGEDLCAKLADAGLPVSKWKQSGFDTGTFECSYEAQNGKGDNEASFFIIVRGTETGELANVRLKVILPDTDGGRAFRDKFVNTVTTLVTESQWPDFQAALEPIGRLENVTLAAFGAKLTFSHEFEDARRFNFVLDLERTTAEQRRAGDYFDTSKWLPVPPQAANIR
ncbi:DUF6030 family protein [Rhizobium sp. BK376]|jgi:hypothetical protein|uniref:DUF6030 family protein n=1 Tax=Rhizobium sp. BK376 TaxID=2512149 RepID=UPI001048199F|nr:DUF6030 family protein [Rhizobium sp. BK376]TCR81550.1 hypothetical protein EV561_112124 [Rhizobium sp. BK376]